MIQPALVSLPSITPAATPRAAGSDGAGDFGGTLATLLGSGTVDTTIPGIAVPGSAAPSSTIASPVIDNVTRQPAAVTGKALPVTGPVVETRALPMLPEHAAIAPIGVTSPTAAIIVATPLPATPLPAGPLRARSLSAPDLLPHEPSAVDDASETLLTPRPAPQPPASPVPTPTGQAMLPRRAARLSVPGDDRPDVPAEPEDADDAGTPAPPLATQDVIPAAPLVPAVPIPVAVAVADNDAMPHAGDGPGNMPGGAAGTFVATAAPVPLANRDPGLAQSPAGDTRPPDALIQTVIPSAIPAPLPMPTPTLTPTLTPAATPERYGFAHLHGLVESRIDVGGVPVQTAPAPDLPPRWSTQDTAPSRTIVAQQPLTLAVQPQPGTVASAAHVFGAAIQAAAHGRDEPADTPAIGPLAAPVAASAIASIPHADPQAPLDMRHERWPTAMIERIEVLRDAANATDTRIRLIPDALGAIDVAVRKDGDTLHVHFNAEQAATRTLLQDAQPRLAELADARGLKLSHGAVETGAGTGQHQQRAATPQQQPQPQHPSAPARRPRADGGADIDSTDTRLA
ncbi:MULTISPECIES: flagellar hook-length control protein FliK [unclassified Sphingomonas]|uniref:flagellar hook-length control protein FliK n=1 Tax=Sphingomonas sp. PvP015 TaxID=3156388 RepID=UPI0033943807